jgi:4-carboxymuconolactone decarboxylase
MPYSRGFDFEEQNMSLDPQSGPAAAEMRYTILPDRMPPMPLEAMTDAQREAAAEMAAGPRGKVDGPYWAILRSPGLMAPMQKVGEYFRFHCRVDKRLGELAILLAARAWTQQFVWEFHASLAIKAGVKEATVAAVAEGRRPLELAEDEQIVYDFITEVLVNKSAADATYARARALLGETGVIDVLGIVGYYTMLATILNVTRVPLDDGRPLPLAPTPAQIRRS